MPCTILHLIFRCAKIESLVDDWVGTGVCKFSSSLCCYDWLSISVVLSIRISFPSGKANTFFYIFQIWAIISQACSFALPTTISEFSDVIQLSDFMLSPTVLRAPLGAWRTLGGG